ncbi:hypothetical protein FJTKL_11663 [Diaporthe vaccinii]|uniref:Uncharacterized protein n=1 Tax=Diaporthe vaccinii TaxID=105482 RepID=A0ABR4EFK7_9PEZI
MRWLLQSFISVTNNFNMITNTLWIILALSVYALATPFPRVCLAEPPIRLVAGENSSFTVENPFNATCVAILAYADPNFLPTSFLFEPITCLGTQTAQLIVPPESPNGDVTISFRCEGQSSESCNHAVISQGLNRSDSITNVHNGLSGCIEPVFLVTTLSETRAAGSTATIQTLVSSIQTSTTRFPGRAPTTDSSTTVGPPASGTTQEVMTTPNAMSPASTMEGPLNNTELSSWTDPAFTPAATMEGSLTNTGSSSWTPAFTPAATMEGSLTNTGSSSRTDPALPPVQRSTTQSTASSKAGPNFTDGITIPIAASSANATLGPLSMTILTSLSTVTVVLTLTSMATSICDPLTAKTNCGL